MPTTKLIIACHSILCHSLTKVEQNFESMEPLPLIPRIQNTVTPEMGCIVREVFQNAFQAETATWRISINLSKSCQHNPDLRQIAAQIQAEIDEHRGALEDLEYAEIKIMESQGYHLCRHQGMMSSERAMEIIRLKRHPLYIDLHPDIIEKYPLLQSDDLLPPVHECATDFRLDKRDRIRMKKRLCRSRDSLLDEIRLPKFTFHNCRFGSISEPKSRRIRSKGTSSMIPTTHKRSIIRSELYLKTILVAEPTELFFHNFKYNKVYKKTVLIKNVSSSMARYRIERRPPHSRFTVLFDTEAVETTKIAPGMHVKLRVLFLCDVIEDPNEYLIINVQSGKTVCVQMHGYRDPPILRALNPLNESDMETSSSCLLSLLKEEGERGIHEEQLTLRNIEEYGKDEPNVRCNINLGANFECGKCFVGERIVIPTRFVNDGGDGKFFIMSEIDWCTMNVDDIMDCNMILIPPFAMWPVYFVLRSGESVEIRTYFYPESYGTQVDKLYILCDNHALHPVELIGDGILYDQNFVLLSDNVEKIGSSVNYNEPMANYHLNMGDIASGETVDVTNRSGLEIYYRWEKHSINCTSSPNSSWACLPIENLDIQPANGFLNSNSITRFKVVAQTEDLQLREYRAILRFYIEDIPLAAVPKDFSDSKITDCHVKRRNCPTTVDILVADIEVWVHCTPGKVSLLPGMSEKTEPETIRWLDEAGKPLNAIQSLSKEICIMSDNSSICGTENVQCNEYYKDMENSENFWSASLGMTQNLEIDASALAVPRLEFHYQTANTAILIPERPLYVGIEQTYTLTLRNLICKPLSYVWGKPLEKNDCRIKVNFDPEKGSIPPNHAALIKVVCLPMDTGVIDNFFVPCFVGGRQDPIMLGIECTIDTLYVTFLFLPASNVILSPCVDSVRVEWHKDGHTSALNLNNLKMNRYSKIEEEHEIKNIDLDAGEVVATVAVGPTAEETENISPSHQFTETPSTSKREFNNLEETKTPNKFVKTSKVINTVKTESEIEQVGSPELRSWESILEGIVWTEYKPDEFLSLTKPQATVPFYKTIVPPIMQALAIEFVDLPLRTVEKRTFVIRNETPVESTILITVKQFTPMEIIKDLNPKITIDVTYANIMGHKSENYWEKIMPPGQGIVLVIEPTSGTLAPYETVPIDIYVYADTWGVYVDEITIAIAGLPDYVIGVCTQVVGSPIAYPICKNGLHEIPVLRFGSLSLATDSVTRKIVIENTSSVMIIVNWYSYLINPRPASENSTLFNVILQMFTPLTNKIANMTSTDLTNDRNVTKISTTDSTMEESQQSILDSDECDSVRGSTIIAMNALFANCCQRETQNQSLCYSESIVSSEQTSPQEKKCEVGNSLGTDNVDDEDVEYTTESEITSVSFSEETIDKETDLELTLTPYYGEPDYSVFTVSPAEIIIPVRGKKTIEITMNVPNDKLRMENCSLEILGRLMGFIRVAPMHKYKADCYSRNDGTLLTPTEIQLEATIMQPKLSHEFTESDRTFKVFASSILTHFGKRFKIRRKYVFSNNDGDTMFVNFQSTEPFQLLSLSTANLKINPSESDGIFVPAGQYVEVVVLCSVDASWIDKAMEMSKYQTTEDSYVDIMKSLLISHVGSCNQVVPLCLRIYLPLLKLSAHNIKFGKVYIGESKRIDLSIKNISSEKQTLGIRAKKNNKDFAIVPDQGILSPRDKTLDVIVTFTASHLGKSVEVLEISTVPDYVEECIIEGYGCSDDKYNDTGE